MNYILKQTELTQVAYAVRLKNEISNNLLFPNDYSKQPFGSLESDKKNLIDRTISEANYSSLTTIGNYAFSACSILTTVNFPACTSIGYRAFNSCSKLTTVSFPVCTSIGSYAFSGCSSLTTANFHVCTSIGSGAFSGCTSLTTASFGSASNIYSSAFFKCFNLLSLYLLGSYVCNLSNKNVFYSTPISTYTTSTGGVYGSIYVPASLLDTYKTKTNWINYSARFVGLTDVQIAALNGGGQ